MGSTPVAANVQAPAHSPLQAAAVLTVISGDVQTRFGGSGFASATDGAVLYVGSTVRTAGDARAVITLFEGSTIELEPASDITIEEASTRSSSTIVQLAQSFGRSWHVVTHLTTADSRYEVRTPAATASVRGTAFEVAVDDALSGPTTTVTTTEGRVATADAAGSGEVLVTADQITTVRANTAPEPPRSAPEAQRVVSVAVMSESSLIVDPLGRTNGFKDGKVFAQTPGARVRMQDGIITVTLPNVPDGVFATTVAASAGAPATVSTTVTDKGEEPVTISNAVEAGSASTTSGVELRKGGDKPHVRSLTSDETQRLSDAKFNAKSKVRVSAGPTQRAAAPTEATSHTTLAPTKKNEATAQPAVTPRRTPSPAPTRR
jgi:FecR-like protein